VPTIASAKEAGGHGQEALPTLQATQNNGARVSATALAFFGSLLASAMAPSGQPLVRHAIDLDHVIDLVETHGLALHDEQPERVAGLFDEMLADFRSKSEFGWYAASAVSVSSSRCPSRASVDARSSAISYWSVALSGTKQIHRHPGVLRKIACQ